MPRPTHSSGMRFITKMAGTYKVQVQFGALVYPQVYFSFRQCGGEEKALLKATRYRDRLVKKHKIPDREYTGNGWYAKAKDGNFSGVAGINLSVTRPNTPYAQVGWSCYYMQEGVQKRVTRSIAKYGYTGAWKLVADLRRAHTQQTIPEVPPPAPEWVQAWAALRQLPLD